MNNIKEYLKLLPKSVDGVNVRELALRNYDKDFYKKGAREIEDCEDALCAAFPFGATVEGRDYWTEIARSMRGVQLPKEMGGLFGLEVKN